MLPWTRNIVFLGLIIISIGYSAAQIPVYDDAYRKHPLLLAADSLRTIEDWDKAIEMYSQAETLLMETENWVGYIYALNQAGYCYRRSRRYNKRSCRCRFNWRWSFWRCNFRCRCRNRNNCMRKFRDLPGTKMRNSTVSRIRNWEECGSLYKSAIRK